MGKNCFRQIFKLKEKSSPVKLFVAMYIHFCFVKKPKFCEDSQTEIVFVNTVSYAELSAPGVCLVACQWLLRIAVLCYIIIMAAVCGSASKTETCKLQNLHTK